MADRALSLLNGLRAGAKGTQSSPLDETTAALASACTLLEWLVYGTSEDRAWATKRVMEAVVAGEKEEDPDERS